MRFRSTLVLALLFVALGAYVYLVEFKRAEEEEKKETLFTFETDDVTAVALVYPDRTIEMRRADGTWRLTTPLDADADQASVDNLIRAIAECEVKRKLEDVSEDLTPYGFDEDGISVRVTLASGELPEIKVGKATPVGFSTYVKRADKPEVFLTGSAFRSGMDKQVKDLRDKTILSFEAGDAEEIALGGEDRGLLLKKTDGRWRIERPGPHAADDATVRGFLSNLTGLRATDFPSESPENLAEYGLEEPRLTVRVSFGEKREPIEVQLGKKEDDEQVYVRVAGRPTIYEVGSWHYRDLDKGPLDFRDRQIFAFTKGDAGTVEVHPRGESAFVLERDESGTWKIKDEPVEPVASTVDRFVDDLAGLKGYEIAEDEPTDLAAFGLAVPSTKISVRDEKGESLGTVLLGSYESDATKAYAAMREGQPTVLRLYDYIFDQVNKKKADFLPKPTPTPEAEAAEPTPAAS
jgi:hypothetical protein